MISDFVGYLLTDWSLKSSGVTGYVNALGHLLDISRSYSDLTKIHSSVFIRSEIYIQRVKRYLSKKNEIRLERSRVCLDYLNSINCWARLEELQKVTPKNINQF